MSAGIIPFNKQKEAIPEIQKNTSTAIKLFSDFSYEEKLCFIRKKRDEYIQETIWVKEKYECQLKEKQIGMTTATDLTQKQYEEWLKYWKELRNLPNKIVSGEMNIDNIKWPIKPLRG
jgi:hypothetical protein